MEESRRSKSGGPPILECIRFGGTRAVHMHGEIESLELGTREGVGRREKADAGRVDGGGGL